ncbi:MAG: hypothetical protein JWL91_417 [Sphingomonas bacterium]|nr:hypothetical protein [Sphingomonas bacterium]MDB5688541.1 hypothetical protein [Sphingomonas bacterium]
MRNLRLVLTAAMLGAAPAHAAPVPEIFLARPLTYADMADLALAAPIVAGVEILKATQLKKAAAVGVPAGQTRFYVEAQVKALIRGRDGLPGQVRYLVDTDPDARGRPAKLRKARAIVLAQPVPERAGELRLARPYAQLPWSEPIERLLRAILTEANGPTPPPRVTGVTGAFHVPGTLPGESETQIFLSTVSGRPVSLSVLRRPGEAPRWAVATGEMIDEAAAPPQRDTLLWYGLACFLPDALPAASTANLADQAAGAAQADYALVRQGLGPCARNYPI